MAVREWGNMGGSIQSWRGQDSYADCHCEGACLGDTEKWEQQYWCKLMHFSQMYFLTCISFIVTNESFGEESDHQSCRSEKRKERGLNLALEV